MVAPHKDVLQDIFFHAAVLIPLEFGLLHATPLGGMLSGWFSDVFASMGFDFAAHGAGAVASVADAVTGGLCHMHGAEMVCH